MLLFFYGEDIWRKKQKIAALISRFTREEDPSRMNVLIFEPGDLNEETLAGKLLAPPFLARKRLVIVKNILSGSRRKEIIKLFLQTIERIGAHTALLISEDIGKPKKLKDWKSAEMKNAWEYLEKHGTCEEFSPFWGAKLEAVITAQVKAAGLNMEEGAIVLLGIMSGGDLGQVEQELEKLTAYCAPSPDLRSPSPSGRGQGEGTVTVQDVKEVCVAQGEANFFEFLDALGNKNKKTLLRTLSEQLEDSEPTRLIAQVSAHIRALLALTLKGESGGQALHLHPFQLSKIKSQMRNWNSLELKRMLTKLMLLDFAVKSGTIADAQTQLTSLLARITI